MYGTLMQYAVKGNTAAVLVINYFSLDLYIVELTVQDARVVGSPTS